MSRIGNQILTVPSGVEVKIDNDQITVKGSKGTLEMKYDTRLNIEIGDTVKVSRQNDSKEIKAIHGTTTALIKNMIIGVTEGYKRELELNGVGYRTQIAGSKITLNVGFSHPVEMEVPKGLTASAPSNTEIVLEGIDKQLIGEFAAKIRKVRPPEPYKGKGIKYKGEHIRRKEGKRAG